MLAEISSILWIIVIICVIIFVTMMFAHIVGPDDYTTELNVLFCVIIFGLAIALITFLISQQHNIKLMNEALERAKGIATNH